jgi:predicted XRE-type DNA-binding protein
MTAYNAETGEMFKDIFDAIETDKVRAANMRLRAEILSRLIISIKEWGVTQKEAALRLGISQPRLNELLKGKMSKFSIDALADLANIAGFSVTIELKKAA